MTQSRQARYEARQREKGIHLVTVRLDAETLARLDALAAADHNGDRSAALRALLKALDPTTAQHSR